MKVGEIWKAKPNHASRHEDDMIELLKSHPEYDLWDVRFFMTEDATDEEKEIFGFIYEGSHAFGTLYRKEILDQFFRIEQ